MNHIVFSICMRPKSDLVNCIQKKDLNFYKFYYQFKEKDTVPQISEVIHIYTLASVENLATINLYS